MDFENQLHYLRYVSVYKIHVTCQFWLAQIEFNNSLDKYTFITTLYYMKF